jgi:asparagine synthase (glutamine-hydrolysing)
MCGIAGVFAYGAEAPPVDEQELLRIREHMIRRGPDGAGLWISDDRRVGLAHRRLAIIDLSDGGAQPMATADGCLRITFNGEIYNYRELRRELEAKGYVFRSQSDTEVLLHLYADRGGEMVHALRGMYAFGIFDKRAQELFLARDPLGIKPLYYADDGANLRFATLVEALLEGGRIDTAEDVAGVAGFYIFGHVPEPFTFHRAVRLLPAGTTLRVGRYSVRGPSRYFSVTEEFRKAESNPSRLAAGEARELVRETLRESMRHHLVADVPVGIFLSAGVDSSVLSSLGAELNPGKVHAVTLGFHEYRGTLDDETTLAERTAASLGLRHTTQWIERRDFAHHGQDFFAAMDQASIDGVNSYLVSKAAAASGLKTSISGVGGDELFGGYPSFRDVPRMRRWVPDAPHAGGVLRAFCAPILRCVTSPKYAGLVEYGSSYAGAYLLRRALHMPWELPRLMGRERAAAALDALRPLERLQETIDGLGNERCIVSALEMCWYMRDQLLRDADWAGMVHGVEIRVPFVDVTVLRALAPMLAGTYPPTKAELVDAIAPGLGAEIAARRKTGFSVPVRDWLRTEFPRQSRQRGLRGWARLVGQRKGGRRFLSFVTDAYGGHGGIALYNRDLLQALCSFPRCASVVAIPRLMPNPPEPMPAKLAYLTAAAGGKLRYLATVLRVLRDDRGYDLVICGHINLLPLAWLTSWRLNAPLALFIHGIDAWQPTRSLFVNTLARRTHSVVAVSEMTAKKFRSWASSAKQQLHVLPNAIHAEWYGPGSKSCALLERYRLAGRTVLMTLGRLDPAEQYKGFDETLEVFPTLIEAVPDVAYLIVGDGDDRGRLEQKARALGIADRVVFAGRVSEAEKADHYRLADVFVMPSRGEGFGFVLLEAMACGIPVIASKSDGGREAVRDGRLGILVDPRDGDALKRTILEALARPKGSVPVGLEYFSFANFEARAHSLFAGVLSEASPDFGQL